MSFFKNLNLARAIALLALIGSAYLFYLNTQKRSELEFLNHSLATTVPQTVENIQRLSQKYSKLIRQKDSEGLSRETSPESYFDKWNDKPGAQLGFLEYTPGDSPYDRGIEDLTYRIRPRERDADYKRDQIAYFMWQLEANSNRLKITDIDFQLANRRGLKEHDIPDDRWTFSLQTTMRQKENP